MPKVTVNLDWNTYERLQRLAQYDQVPIESLICRALHNFAIEEEVDRASSMPTDILTRQDHLLGSDECMDKDLSSPSESIG